MKDYALFRLLAKTAHRRTRVAKPNKVSSRMKGKRVGVVIVDELVDFDAETIAEFNGSHADEGE